MRTLQERNDTNHEVGDVSLCRIYLQTNRLWRVIIQNQTDPKYLSFQKVFGDREAIISGKWRR